MDWRALLISACLTAAIIILCLLPEVWFLRIAAVGVVLAAWALLYWVVWLVMHPISDD